MANETPINTNTAFVQFTSNYEYVLGATTGRLLEFQGMFHRADFLAPQLEMIRQDLEDTAKFFAEEQGLSPHAVGWGKAGYDANGQAIYRYNTGTLYNGIRAVKTNQTIHLKSEAKDKYGHYYGGHVEFGHGTVPARPHLRPALYAVSQASQGLLRSALYNLLAGAFNGDMNLGFGTGGGLSASYYRRTGFAERPVRQSFSHGAQGRQAKYHFGSIRSGPNVSRKAQTFRNSFSSTAKRSMGWGKQRALGSAQRSAYRRDRSVRTARDRKSLYGRKVAYQNRRLSSRYPHQTSRYRSTTIKGKSTGKRLYYRKNYSWNKISSYNQHANKFASKQIQRDRQIAKMAEKLNEASSGGWGGR